MVQAMIVTLGNYAVKADLRELLSHKALSSMHVASVIQR